MHIYAVDSIGVSYHTSKREALKEAKDDLGFYCEFSEVYCYSMPSLRSLKVSDVLKLLDEARYLRSSLFRDSGWECIAKFGYELTDKRERWVQSYPTHKVLKINRSRG